MKQRLLGIFLVVLLVSSASLFAQQKSTEYAALLAKVKAGDTGIDFARLRLSWMDSKEREEAKDTGDAEKQMFESLNGKDFAKALKDADTVIASEYVNLDAHFVAYIAHRELQETEKAKFHRAVFNGLAKSILDSGDGKTPEKAMVVIAVHEEYVVMRILGVSATKQSVTHTNGHSYDVMEVQDNKSGATGTLYFNVDIPFKSYKL